MAPQQMETSNPHTGKILPIQVFQSKKIAIAGKNITVLTELGLFSVQSATMVLEERFQCVSPPCDDLVGQVAAWCPMGMTLAALHWGATSADC